MGSERLTPKLPRSNLLFFAAIENTWPLTGEMFEPAAYENLLLGNRIGVDVSNLKNDWLKKIQSVFDEATLPVPGNNIWMQRGGKEGIHSEGLGYLLAEMQFLQRAYPGCDWELNENNNKPY